MHLNLNEYYTKWSLPTGHYWANFFRKRTRYHCADYMRCRKLNRICNDCPCSTKDPIESLLDISFAYNMRPWQIKCIVLLFMRYVIHKLWLQNAQEGQKPLAQHRPIDGLPKRRPCQNLFRHNFMQKYFWGASLKYEPVVTMVCSLNGNLAFHCQAMVSKIYHLSVTMVTYQQVLDSGYYGYSPAAGTGNIDVVDVTRGLGPECQACIWLHFPHAAKNHLNLLVV